MISKKTLIIAAVILLIIIVYVNRENWGLVKPKEGKIDPNAMDVSNVSLNQIQGSIDALLKAQADNISAGNTDTAEFEMIQKKVQILKLEQKTNIKFSPQMVTTLMGISVVELMNLNMMSIPELQAYAQAWNDEHSGTSQDIIFY